MPRLTVFLITPLMLMGFLSVGVGRVSAETPAQINEKACSEEAPSIPCPDDNTKQCVPLCNPLKSGTTDIKEIIGIIIRSALGLVGSLTLLMVVWGGFKWLTSAGNPEKVKSGSQTMLWAGIGVFLVFASYFILSNFTDYLTGRK